MTNIAHEIDSSDDKYEEAWDLETALDHVGVGCFQWTALAVCGLANAADAVEILGLSLVLPAAEDDLHLTPAGKSALSSCIFVGMLLGGLVWGPLGDALGRRMTLAVSLLINAVFGMLSAAARGVNDLVLLRLLAGVGVGGSVPVVFSFLAELLPARARGKFMVGLASFWMVGSLYAAGVGWAMIPAAGWRAFLVVAALPGFAAAAGTLLLLPESPRFLLVQGSTQKAEQAIKRMARVNKVKLPPNMSLQHHQSHLLANGNLAAAAAATAALAAVEDTNGHFGSISDGPVNSSSSRNGTSQLDGASQGQRQVVLHSPAAFSIEVAISDTLSHGAGASSGAARLGRQTLMQHAKSAVRATGACVRQLLQPPLSARFFPLLVAWIGMCGGWYSTVLWIPEYFKARGTAAASLYAETFAVAAANLPGNIASVFMVDWLGRRLTACICLAGSCIAALLFAAAPAHPVWSVVAACVFNAISVGGWNALDLLSAELFPTEVRSTAMGMLGASGRLASFTTTFLAGALMSMKLWAPLVVAAGLLAAGSIAMLLLPEMALKPLEDTVEDAAAARSSSQGGSAATAAAEPAGLRALSGALSAISDGVLRRRSCSLADEPQNQQQQGGTRALTCSSAVLQAVHGAQLCSSGRSAGSGGGSGSGLGRSRDSGRGFRGSELVGAPGAAEEGCSLLLDAQQQQQEQQQEREHCGD